MLLYLVCAFFYIYFFKSSFDNLKVHVIVDGNPNFSGCFGLVLFVCKMFFFFFWPTFIMFLY